MYSRYDMLNPLRAKVNKILSVLLENIFDADIVRSEIANIIPVLQNKLKEEFLKLQEYKEEEKNYLSERKYKTASSVMSEASRKHRMKVVEKNIAYIEETISYLRKHLPIPVKVSSGNVR